MSAKYKCDACGRKLPCSYKKHEIYEEVDGSKTPSGTKRKLLVNFSVEFFDDTGDICIPCALKAIQMGAKKAKTNINNVNAIKHAENCGYH